MQISIALLPRTLFPRHTSDTVQLACHGSYSFSGFHDLCITGKDKKISAKSCLRVLNNVNAVVP